VVVLADPHGEGDGAAWIVLFRRMGGMV
jgi:hypothetical protein